VLAVLESRDKASVVAYLQAGKASGLFAQLAEVTTDMWDGYVAAVRDVFGDTVRVTIDRCHVMKNYQEQLTAARRQIQRALAKDEAQAPKGTRWRWVTNWENLDAAPQAELTQRTLRQLFEERTIPDAAAGMAGCLLPDAGELVGPDCQLLGQPGQQRSHRGLQSWLA
jgi:transposase